jgi:hypothetical protein
LSQILYHLVLILHNLFHGLSVPQVFNLLTQSLNL